MVTAAVDRQKRVGPIAFEALGVVQIETYTGTPHSVTSAQICLVLENGYFSHFGPRVSDG